MPELHFERHVPFSPAQMMALVADLNSYPEFVPNCTDMQVEPDRGDPGNVRFARMSVQWGPLSQAYTSRVTVDTAACRIDAKAVDGPFSHLDSKWRFDVEGEGTKVRFDIDFGFSNPLIAAAAGQVFTAKQAEIVDAFMDEAKRRYG
jgi:coenzyme Q-binding protein COQ10